MLWKFSVLLRVEKAILMPIGIAALITSLCTANQPLAQYQQFKKICYFTFTNGIPNNSHSLAKHVFTHNNACSTEFLVMQIWKIFAVHLIITTHTIFGDGILRRY